MPAPTVTLIDADVQNFGGGVNTIVTDSIPAGTGPYLLFIADQQFSAIGYDVTGAGLTWSTVEELDGGSGSQHLCLYLGEGTPSTGAISAVPKAGTTFNNRSMWWVFDVAGLDSISDISTFTNPFGNTTPVGPTTITGTPDANSVTFAVASSGRDLSGALTGWSSGWTDFGSTSLNSVGEITAAVSTTNDQAPTANFTSTFNNALPGMVAMILHGLAGGGLAADSAGWAVL